MRRTRAISFAAACALASLVAGRCWGEETEYLRDVKPIFIEKCSSCHGPLKQEASLRLDAASLIQKGGDSGPAAAPGEFEKTLLFERVATDDLATRMPPEGEGEKLTEEQFAHLKRWIAAGMPAPADERPLPDPADHWAFQPLDRNARGPGEGGSGAGGSPDVMIDAKLASAGIEPLPEADRATLVRRLYFDLIGLPPTVEETRAILADESPDAYERLVDRLLEDPRYGERWGRHWMDVWRYSDWDGYKDELRSSSRHLWHWRDWIVRSLNEDKPYDRMIAEMLAGDELAPEDPEALAATGFLARNYHHLNRDIWLDWTTEHSAKAFVGLTIACAKCHDHKFDPLSQTEYYAWRALFEPHRVRTDRLPGQIDVMQDGLPRAYDADPAVPTYLYIRGDEKHPDKERPIAPGVPAILGESLTVAPIELPPMAYFPALAEHVERDLVDAAEDQIAAARASVEECEKAAAIEEAAAGAPSIDDGAELADVATEREEASAAIKLAELSLAEAECALQSLRARYASDRAKHALPKTRSEEELKTLAREASAAERRHAAAVAERELFERRQALTKAQSSAEPDEKKRTEAVAKAKGEAEAATKKRDEALANVEKVDEAYAPVGESYSKTSAGRRLALARWIASPDNPLTARVAVNHVWMRHFGKPLVANPSDFGVRTPRPVQLDVLDSLAREFIDSGWSFKALHRRIVTSKAWRRASSAEPETLARNEAVDQENALLWRQSARRLEAEPIRDAMLYVAGKLDATTSGPDLDPSQGEKVYRRSLYFRHAREKQMKMLTLFDGASPDDCYRRAESVVPQQALAVANSELARTMSRTLARQLSGSAESPVADERFVDLAFETTLGRSPTEEERGASLAFLAKQRESLSHREKLTALGGAQAAATPASDDPALRARESLTHVLFSHNDFVTIR
ncbi:MAG TPA: DUF1553 domain-containing protein [Pirellulaceae bacterium]|jgi:mono/diheme cytochrome c family protein|nr:DUF1553 domain-containing protein [Pirellulaceae bacterium]